MAIGVAPVDFDDPFAILEACHERIERMLRTLERLHAHVAANGVDEDARQAIGRVMHYFDEAGPHHHADEEVDLFPALRRAAGHDGDGAPLEAIDRLEADHRAMDVDWRGLREHLGALCVGVRPVDQTLVARFASRYRDHIEREEGVVYRYARVRIGPDQRSALARAMAARRRID